MKTLLMVDIQNDFLTSGALAVPDGDAIIAVVNRLQEKFSSIVASKDWHPKNHSSFEQLWPSHCVEDTVGAEFPPCLHTEKIEKIIFKGTDPRVDSYSAFFDNEHKRSTGLHEYLQHKGIDEIYVVGLATDYCVKYSVLDALKLGYKVYVVLDACRGIGDVEKATDEMHMAGATIITSSMV